MKHYLIYKTTCIKTNKFYIGMHETFNKEDSYLGSGKILKLSINKYGKENHSKEILYTLECRDSMITKEIEVVSKELLKDPKCMNIKLGGDGGFDRHSEETKKQMSLSKLGAKNSFFGKTHSEEAKNKISNSRLGKSSWNNGIERSDETKKKISASHKARTTPQTKEHRQKNSEAIKQMLWINDGLVTKRIKKGEALPIGFKLGRKIKRKYNIN